MPESEPVRAAGAVTLAGAAVGTGGLRIEGATSGTRAASAAFTAAGVFSTGAVLVSSGSFTDAAGNNNADGSEPNNTLALNISSAGTGGAGTGGGTGGTSTPADINPPTVAVSSNKANLATGETATISFTLSESSTDFNLGDVTVIGGTLSNFTGSGTTYSASAWVRAYDGGAPAGLNGTLYFGGTFTAAPIGTAWQRISVGTTATSSAARTDGFAGRFFGQHRNGLLTSRARNRFSRARFPNSRHLPAPVRLP
jgi:hypothetical protein